MKAPKAVLISDIHYNLKNLQLAKAALEQALAYAAKVDVSLIIAGDLTNDKALMRGEVVNSMLETFINSDHRIILLVGNHDRLNEKAPDHALRFLDGLCEIIEEPEYHEGLNMGLIPYQHAMDPHHPVLEFCRKHKAPVIMHQGVMGAAMGEYVVDHSSLPPETFDGLRVISGHYHRAQDIQCGETGKFSYIGSPYTISFTEASDPVKGFRVLYDDGSLETVATNLRKHVIVERTESNIYDPLVGVNPGDLVWIKLSGPRSVLDTITKGLIAERLGIQDFKLDKYPAEDGEREEQVDVDLGPGDVLDSIIDSSGDTDGQKRALKALWRELV